MNKHKGSYSCGAAGLTSVPIRRFQNGVPRGTSDTIATEVSVTLNWPGRAPARLWAYPSNLDELALGHAKLEFCGPDENPRLAGVKDNTFDLAPAPAPRQPPASRMSLDAPALVAAMRELIETGGRWDATGCFHRAGAFDAARGVFVRVVEDIGRHNCIDRLAGWALMNNARLDALVLIVTARATASLAAKAAKAGFPALISRSAVTTAAVAEAGRTGMALAGFTREKEDRTSIFADPAGMFSS